MSVKYDKNLAGIQITDELHNSIGAALYNLIHDTFFGGTEFDIYTAPASGGVHLVENTHFTLHDEDTGLTIEAGKVVFTALKIIDPTYQAVDLYFTYKTIGDYNEAADIINFPLGNHVRVTAPSWSKGVAAPIEGYIGIFPTLEFDAVHDDEAHYSLIVPFKIQSGSVIDVHVDWAYEGGADAGTVCWGLEYKNVAVGEALVGGTTTILGTSPGGHTTGTLVRTTLATGIVGAVEHDVIGLRLYRDISGGTLAVDASLIEVHFEVTEDKLGQPI